MHCLTHACACVFIIQGGYAGEAAGFKMMSLLKLPEIRANGKPGINLIHFIAHQAEKNPDRNLAQFAQELPNLDEASKYVQY